MNRDPNGNLDANEPVTTPGGVRPKDRVHVVPPGTTVRSDPAESAAALPHGSASAFSHEMVSTPGGPRHRSRVRMVRPGEMVDATGGQPPGDAASSAVGGPGAHRLSPPNPPGASNWICSTQWQNTTGSPITSFRTTWRVPPNPATRATQLIYLFNGLQPANGSVILQPVLQWGDSGPDADGVNRTGPFWTVASWVVHSSGDADHTPHVRVHAGDVLVGVMSLTGHTHTPYQYPRQFFDTYRYACQFEGIAGTDIGFTTHSELVSCFETLEAYETTGAHTPPYDLNAAAEYPAAIFTLFEHIGISTGISKLTGRVVNPTVAWNPVNVVTNYGEHARVLNNSSTAGAVELFYGPSPLNPRLPIDTTTGS